MGLRLLKINESIKETLSSVITAEGLKDPRIGFVTLTGVETSPDLRHAKVYLSVLGDQTERDLTMQALEKSRGFLQAQINASLHMKRTPQLSSSTTTRSTTPCASSARSSGRRRCSARSRTRSRARRGTGGGEAGHDAEAEGRRRPSGGEDEA